MDSIESMTPIDAVRKRPGMYVGDTEDGSGLINLVLEVLANAYDQYLCGRCTAIRLVVAADGTIEIVDDGPGLTEAGDGVRPPLVELLTKRSDKPTADGHRPHVHLGLGGMGLCVVNALSERFELFSVRDGVAVTAICVRGNFIEPIASTPVDRANGTTVRFRPDRAIFLHARLPRAELTCHLEDLTFLSPRLTLRWTIEGDDLAAAGLAGLVALQARCALADVAYHRGTYATPSGPIEVEVALAAPSADAYPGADATLHSFVNLGRTRGDGYHADGLQDGVAAFVGGRRKPALRGLVAAVSVALTDVRYGNPTKDRLDSPEARAPVAEATRTALEAWAMTHADAVASWRARADGNHRS